MKFIIHREDLLKPLQQVTGVVEKRQTLPILGNLLVDVREDRLFLTGTDLEVELVTNAPLTDAQPGLTTVSARKLLDICRSLPEQAVLEVKVEDGRIKIVSGHSRFTLATLSADEFPNVERVDEAVEFTLPQSALRRLINRTHFAMAQQDVRYFLIGLLLEMEQGTIRAVATDGHRLAMCEMDTEAGPEQPVQVIVPRKGVMELLRLMQESEADAQIRLGSHHIQVDFGEVRFTSKLIDGKFPDYNRAIPRGGDKVLTGDRESIRQALTRASILSNEKFRGVRLQISEGTLRALAYNPEQEEAEEEIAVEFTGDDLEIGFNVSYLLDALSALDGNELRIVFSDSDSSCLIQGSEADRCRYVVMPMRL